MTADLIARLRDQHSDLRQEAYYSPHEDPDWDVTALAAGRIEKLEAKVALMRRVLRLCAHDNEFDVTIEHMTIWPDFNGYATLRRLLREDPQ